MVKTMTDYNYITPKIVSKKLIRAQQQRRLREKHMSWLNEQGIALD